MKKHGWSQSIFYVVVLLIVSPSLCQADLLQYVKKADDSYSWKVVERTKHEEGMVYTLELISQTWQRITWKHHLQVFLPKDVKPNATMFLWNQGGRPSKGSMATGMLFAKQMKIPVAFLYGIPNQPLFGGKTEDALIAETFVRYLKAKDGDWPLLFPMVKSLVKAMDALQEFAKQEWNVEVQDFIVSGASKRGWTTWLTGAVEPRVRAIAPLVIDTLNMRDQGPYQLKSFGKYSEQIHDYYEAGLLPMPDTKEALALWKMVDPYTYRDKLTMPRLIINGANDPYWTTDALNLYWNDLKGDNKWVVYVPNAGHDLTEHKSLGLQDRVRAINALCAFVRHQVKNNPMPKVQWKHEDRDGQPVIEVSTSERPNVARLWVAEAPTRDFRKQKWMQQTIKIPKSGPIAASPNLPSSGCRAYFMELEFEIDGIRFPVSTQIRILTAEKK